MKARQNRVALKRFKGVYFRESTSAKWRGKPDRCYWILFTNARTGKKQWEKCGWASEGWTPEAAQLRRGSALEEDRAGDYKPKKEREKEMLTFGELANKYIEWAKGSKKSWRDDAQRYDKHLKPDLSRKPLKAIMTLQLEKLKRDLDKKDLAPATIKHCLVLVRQMYNKAIAWGLYEGTNPVKQVKLPKVNNRRIRFLSYKEADLLLKKLLKHSSVLYDQAVLSIQCGLRFGEIANLIGSDLNFVNDTIHIRDPKGHSRDTYMTNEVKEILSKRNPANPSEYIFPDNKGNRQHEVSNTFGRIVDNLGFNQGITHRKDKVVFHTLRHTFASWLAMQGTPIFTIKELMGHKSIEMTMRYAHLIPDQKKEAVKELESKFNSAKSAQLGIVKSQ